MTIEGRPYLGLDKTYEKQRKDRMGDAIGDYLTDEAVSSRQIYEEMLSEVQEWIDYHRKFLTKAEHLREYLMGNRPVDLEAPTSSTQTLYEDILNYKA
tara:strand:+ start:85 stop:378 length:294 start_codon:yes stop_codon:yes gene_type:complete